MREKAKRCMCAFDALGLEQHLRTAIDITSRDNMPSKTVKELIKGYAQRMKKSCDVNLVSIIDRANAQKTPRNARDQYGNALSSFHLDLINCKASEEYRR